MATTMTGTVFKRCGCTEAIPRPDGTTTRKQLGRACPQLTYADGRWARDHGTLAAIFTHRDKTTPNDTARTGQHAA